ncbi:hypothetical protein ACVWYN_001673 [Pedobacter sp. UYP24]
MMISSETTMVLLLVQIYLLLLFQGMVFVQSTFQIFQIGDLVTPILVAGYN